MAFFTVTAMETTNFRNQKQNKLHGLSLQANYTDQVTAPLLMKLVPTFTDR
jgi:hypothetical protein